VTGDARGEGEAGNCGPGPPIRSRNYAALGVPPPPARLSNLRLIDHSKSRAGIASLTHAVTWVSAGRFRGR